MTDDQQTKNEIFLAHLEQAGKRAHHVRYDYSRIPRHMREGLTRYIQGGIEPGSFLSAVLKNDLKGAITMGDLDSLELMPVLVTWLYNRAPSGCSGSEERFRRWMMEGGAPKWNADFENYES